MCRMIGVVLVLVSPNKLVNILKHVTLEIPSLVRMDLHWDPKPGNEFFYEPFAVVALLRSGAAKFHPFVKLVNDCHDVFITTQTYRKWFQEVNINTVYCCTTDIIQRHSSFLLSIFFYISHKTQVVI